MRSLENHLATRSFFEEATEQRKLADKLEIEERKQYDIQARQSLSKKEKLQQSQHQQKIQKCHDYWTTVRDKTTEKYTIRIQAKESEIKATKQLIDKLQSETDDANSKANDTSALEENNQQKDQDQNEEHTEVFDNNEEEMKNEENNNVIDNNEEEMKNEENTETMSAIMLNITSPISGIETQNEDNNGNLGQTLQPKAKGISPKQKRKVKKSNSDFENVEDITIDANIIEGQIPNENENNVDKDIAQEDNQSQKSLENDASKPTKPRKVVKKKIVKKVVKKVVAKAATD